MQMAIRFSGGKRSDFGNHAYEEVLSNALDRFGHQLKKVTLYVQDINGPRGGVDKQARCVLHLRSMPPIVISDKDASMSALLYRVANRASYALSQKTDRRAKRIRQNRTGRKQPLFVTPEETPASQEMAFMV